MENETIYCGNAFEYKKRGRTITKDVKNNKEYFNDYYREHNHDIRCECGQYVKYMSLCKHKKSKKHSYLMNHEKII